MRILNLLLLSLGLLAVSSACQRKSNPKDAEQTVNAVIGDRSFLATFDHLPDEHTNEQLRLSTHLKYVEQLLRSKPVDHLNAQLRRARRGMLDLLNEYTAAADYPKNFDYPDRRIPCFIDRTGSICAVGYLIEQTAGPEVARAISSEYQYNLIAEMNNPTIDEWIAESGLTKEECAMIQPSYQPYPIIAYTPNTVGPGYAISSSALSGLNFSLTVANSMQMLNGKQKKIVPYLGLATGAGQIALGIGIYPQKYDNRNIVSSGDQIFSGINIGLGTATMAMSALNLLINKTPQNKDLSWNVYSFQTPDQQAGIGFYVAKRF